GGVGGVRALNAAGSETGGRVVLRGGGARSRAYRQILADLTGRPVAIADADEATARGAAVQAAAMATGTGVEDVRSAWAPSVTEVAWPRPGSADRSAEIVERYAVVADWTAFDGKGGTAT
ncbi:MAG: FGGY-family carbohydrate kinase, partial [Frankia sp.]